MNCRELVKCREGKYNNVYTVIWCVASSSTINVIYCVEYRYFWDYLSLERQNAIVMNNNQIMLSQTVLYIFRMLASIFFRNLASIFFCMFASIFFCMFASISFSQQPLTYTGRHGRIKTTNSVNTTHVVSFREIDAHIVLYKENV